MFKSKISDKIMKLISGVLPVIDAEAHCDIPCGIYDPTPAKIAAKTVQRMVMQINELKAPDMMDELAIKSYLNSIGRRVAVKESHAEICKKELQILWSDFFKSEHLEKYPNLHDTFWKALKLCSKNKQEINIDAASDLIKSVDEIAMIFYEIKGDPKRFDSYKDVTDKLF